MATTTLTSLQSEIADTVTAIETLTSDAKDAATIVDDVIDAIKDADTLSLTGSAKLDKVLSYIYAAYQQYVENGDKLKALLTTLIDDVVSVLNAGAVVVGSAKVWFEALVEKVKATIKELVSQLKDAWESIWDIFDGDDTVTA